MNNTMEDILELAVGRVGEALAESAERALAQENFTFAVLGVAATLPDQVPTLAGTLSTILSTVLVALLGVLVRIIRQKKLRLQAKLDSLAGDTGGTYGTASADPDADSPPSRSLKADGQDKDQKGPTGPIKASYTHSVRKLLDI